MATAIDVSLPDLEGCQRKSEEADSNGDDLPVDQILQAAAVPVDVADGQDQGGKVVHCLEEELEAGLKTCLQYHGDACVDNMLG